MTTYNFESSDIGATAAKNRIMLLTAFNIDPIDEGRLYSEGWTLYSRAPWQADASIAMSVYYRCAINGGAPDIQPEVKVNDKVSWLTSGSTLKAKPDSPQSQE